MAIKPYLNNIALKINFAFKSHIYRKFFHSSKKYLKFFKKSVDDRLKIIKMPHHCHAVKRTVAKTKRFEVL